MKNWKKTLALLLVLCMMFSLGGTAFAEGKKIEADGVDKDKDFVSISVSETGDKDADALSIVSDNGGSADVTVSGDITAEAEDGRASGAELHAGTDSEASLDVGGSVSASSDDGRASGVKAGMSNGPMSISVGGDVTVSGDTIAAGVSAESTGDTVKIDVGGSVSATGECDAYAVGVHNGIDTSIQVGGDATADAGTGKAGGVDVVAHTPASGQGEISVAVDGNVSASSNDNDAGGVSVSGEKNTDTSVSVGGGVSASAVGNASGAYVVASDGGTAAVTVTKDVTAEAGAGNASGAELHAGTGSEASLDVGGSVSASSVDGRASGVKAGMSNGPMSISVGGDVTVSGDTVATGVSSESTGDTVTIDVGGSVSATGECNAYAVGVYNGIDTSIQVGGDATADAGTGKAGGVDVVAHTPASGEGEISVTVDGSVSASSYDDDAQGISISGEKNTDTSVSVGGGVSASSVDNASGAYVEVSDGGTAAVTVAEDVTAEAGAGNASGAVLHAGAGSEASLSIGGDVTASSVDGGASGVTVFADEESEVSVSVGGDIEADGSSGVYGLNIEADGGSSVDASVEGSVTADGTYDAVGAEVDAGSGAQIDVSINGEIHAEGKFVASGVSVFTNNGSQADISVEGDISAESEFYAYGVSVSTYEDESKATVSIVGNVTAQANRSASGVGVAAYSGSEVDITMEGDIKATNPEDSRQASGISLYTKDSDITMDFTGDVSSSGDGIDVEGVCFSSGSPAEGSVTLMMTGDVTAGEYALVRMNEEESSAVSEILIDGTLHGDKGGVLVSENITEDNLKLTVWKIDLDEDENAVVTVGDGGETQATDSTRALEESIHYIIKLEPTEGADIGLLGTSKRTIDDKVYDEALENDVVTMVINLKDGYILNGAFNGKGEKIPLLMDEDGNYYVIVPKGGGVYLSASIVKIQSPVYNPKPQSEKATITFELDGGMLDGDEGPILVKAKVGKTIKLLDEPERDGFSFVCWELEVPGGDPLSYDPGDSFKVEGDAVFTAVWEELD